MEYYKLNKDGHEEKPKRPQFLNILLIISGINILFGLYGTVKQLRYGALSSDELDEAMEPMYTSIQQLKDQNMGESLVNMVESVINYSVYVNNHSFLINAYLLIFAFIVGGASLYFMYNLKKIGFHIYILYSILPVVTMYIVAPAYLIPNLIIVFYVIQSAILAILYGRNLKYMD